jgi:tRNA uridine 5-carboxymethylaminomethyl modification enzyme
LKEKELADKITNLEGLYINDKIDYKKIPSLSAEAQEKLSKIRPKTIGQASRISGVNPSDIAILIVYIGRK